MSALLKPEDCAVIEYDGIYQAWLVYWIGYQHGGCHFNEKDAIAHAELLDGYPDDAREDWLAMHDPRALTERNHWCAKHGYGS